MPDEPKFKRNVTVQELYAAVKEIFEKLNKDTQDPNYRGDPDAQRMTTLLWQFPHLRQATAQCLPAIASAIDLQGAAYCIMPFVTLGYEIAETVARHREEKGKIIIQ